MRSIIVLAIFLMKYGVLCEDTEADFWRLPKLFHLDEFDRCLARSDGIYCLGQFEVYSDVENNPLYDLIQEKSQNLLLYNRSYLHRGYCLPTRCPGGEANASARFERCVDAWARAHSLRARLHTLHYCRAHGQPPPLPSTDEPSYTIFMVAVLAILAMNAIGTLYDFMIGPKDYKNKYLMMFSLRANWKKLIALNEVGESSLRGLSVLNGFKGLLLLGAVVAHVGVITAQAYQYNPRFIEKHLASPAGGMLGSLTTATQSFVVISIFLTTFNLLQLSDKMKIDYSGIPLFFLRRVMRMLPVYLLMIGFSATWWTAMGDGPLWPLIVGSENQVCREKFWPQTFFVQNMVDSHKICNVQTWVLSVDIQLYIPALMIIIWLMKRKDKAIPIIFGLLVAATALTAFVTLSRKFIPMFHLMTPENLRLMFIDQIHFHQFFVMPINCIMSMVCGILLGFMFYNMQRNVKPKDEKKTSPSLTMIIMHNLSIPMFFIWAYIAALLRSNTDPIFMALIIPLERLAYSLFVLSFFYTSTKVKSIFTNTLGWRGLRVLSRISMSVSMVHWVVNKILVANRASLYDSSQTSLLLDTIDVSVISCALAIPLTLMVELPMSKITVKIINNMFLK